MKKTSRILAMLLALMLLISVFPTASLADEVDEPVDVTFDLLTINWIMRERVVAVVFDMGEGNEVLTSSLDKDTFNIHCRNNNASGVQQNAADRNIARVYANTVPEMLDPFQRDIPTELPASGRYVIVELVFWPIAQATAASTGNDSIAFKQVYTVTQKNSFQTTNGKTFEPGMVAYNQGRTINDVLDRFEYGQAQVGTNNPTNYRLFRPDDVSKPQPLVVVQHGGGQGTDNECHLRFQNNSYFAWPETQEEYPAYVLMPANCTSAAGFDNIKSVIDEMVADGLVDPDRIYITGHSMGGTATWNFVARYPDLFAAVAPLATAFAIDLNEELLNALDDMPIWEFTTQGDSQGTGAVNMNSRYGSILGNYKYTLLPHNNILEYKGMWYSTPGDANTPGRHGAWLIAYNYYGWNDLPEAEEYPHLVDTERGRLIDWMFAQSKAPKAPAWRLVDPANIQIGKEYLIVSEHGALANELVTSTWISTITSPLAGLAGKPVKYSAGGSFATGANIVGGVTDDMIWQFGAGGNTAAANSGLGTGAGYYIRNDAPGTGGGRAPLRRESSNNLQIAPFNSTNAVANANQQSVLVHVADAATCTVGLYIWGGNNTWNFAVQGREDGFTLMSPSAATTSGAALLALLESEESVLKIYERDVPAVTEHFIMSSAGANGTISPTSLSGHVWVEEGKDQVFTFAPAYGYIVDEVRINNVVTPVTGNSYTFTNVTDSTNTISVTFKVDPGKIPVPLNFKVYNDVFASGPVTSALIVDLGEGNAANRTDIADVNFSVSARNTQQNGTTVIYNGPRIVSRAYVNTKPELLGYITPAPGSAGVVTGNDLPSAGRYIIIELEFMSPQTGPLPGAMGSGGLDQVQVPIYNYSISVDRDIRLTNTNELFPNFVQTEVVSPILDKFVATTTAPAGNSAILLYEDESWQTDGPLPIFIYNHGGGRGGSQPFGPLMTSNGASMLARYQIENPGKYNAHIIATQNINATNTKAFVEKMIAEGKVDKNRVYMSGFSAGSSSTVNFMVQNPGFLAAIVPIGGQSVSWPSAATLEANPAIFDTAVWAQINLLDNNPTSSPRWLEFFTNGPGTGFKNGNLTVLETNQAFNYPFLGLDWSSTHESESAVFSNKIGQTKALNRIGPSHEAYWGKNIFDWMFDQSLAPESDIKITAGVNRAGYISSITYSGFPNEADLRDVKTNDFLVTGTDKRIYLVYAEGDSLKLSFEPFLPDEGGYSVDYTGDLPFALDFTGDDVDATVLDVIERPEVSYTVKELGDPLWVGPNIYKDPSSPTGYRVTYLYYNPDATSVVFRGKPTVSEIGNRQAAVSIDEFRPNMIRDGSVGINMEKITEGEWAGYWVCQTPLHAGTNQYWFLANQTANASGTGYNDNAEWLLDPANPPVWGPSTIYNSTYGRFKPRRAFNMTYIPYDAEKQDSEVLAARAAYETPRSDGKTGTLTWEVVENPQNPAKPRYLGVYTPYGYDPDRAEPYKTIYITGATDHDEGDWFSIGGAQNIMDNLLAEGLTEPAVIVSVVAGLDNDILGTAANGFDGLFNHVIPYVENNFNVSTEAADRAFGGHYQTPGNLINYDATSFGYFLMVSTGSGSAIQNAPNVASARYFFTNGLFEGALNMGTLPDSDAQYIYYRTHGGHDFHAWTQAIPEYFKSLWKPEKWAREKEATFDLLTLNWEMNERIVAAAIDMGSAVDGDSLDLDTFRVYVENRNPNNGNIEAAQSLFRTITKVYVNNVPEQTDNPPATGRYVIIEMAYWNYNVGALSGSRVASDSYKYITNYTIYQDKDFKAVGGRTYTSDIVTYTQRTIINELKDRFQSSMIGTTLGIELFTPDSHWDFENKRQLEEVDEALPLVLLLHGGSQGINNQKAQMSFQNNLYFAMPEQQAEYPAYVLLPASVVSSGVGAWDAARIDALKALIDDLIDEGKVDPSRIYVTGGSMGSSGTCNFITRYPNYFAAAAPMAGIGGITEAQAQTLVDLPIWFFQNINDNVARWTSTKTTIDRIAPHLNDFRVTLYTKNIVPELGNTYIVDGHAVWLMAYNVMNDPVRGRMIDWMFAQSRSKIEAKKDLREAVAAYDAADLSQYTEEALAAAASVIDAARKTLAKPLDYEVRGSNSTNLSDGDYTDPMNDLYASPDSAEYMATEAEIKEWIDALNGFVKADVAITSTLKTIVAGYAANLPADVVFSGEPVSFALGLYDPSGTLLSTIEVSENGRYMFKIAATEAVAGTYTIKTVGTANGVTINCVAQPDDLWVPAVTVDGSSVTVTFASEVTFNAAKKGVKIGNTTIANSNVSVSEKVVTITDVIVEQGQPLVISGVKYADLFPSYSFTFTLQVLTEKTAALLYQGHGSLRITTREGKVIYIDPYAGEGYDVPADMILVTHPHPDHTAVNLIETKNPDCMTITHEESLIEGVYKVFETDYVTVEAVQAGNNPNHNINVCVGYILTFSDGKSVYISGDTSTTAQMATFAQRNLDYAFFSCDGRYNMGLEEAAACAKLVQARYSIPYHIAPGKLFDKELAEQFNVENRLILADGEEISIH